MTGRDLPPTSAFAGDDGSADPGLAVVLADRGEGTVSVEAVVTAFAAARVLVPILPVPDADDDGARRTATGVVAVAGPDGRTALPVFSSLATLSAWHEQARPVPTPGPTAAAAVLAEGWEILVLDPAGPVTVVVPRPAVRALAEGTAWRPAVRQGEVRPDIRAAVVRATRELGHVRATDVVAGRVAEVAVLLDVEPGLTRAGLDEVLAEVGRRLALDLLVTADVDTVELRVRPT